MGVTRLKKTYVVWLVILTMFISSIGTYVGIKWFENDRTKTSGMKQEQTTPIQKDFSKIEKAYDLISEGYIEEVKGTELVEGAVEGMLAKLEDPYSVYMNEEKSNEFNQTLDSSFEGIGAEISEIDGRIIIVSPFKNSPAEKAGLKPNDEIIAVDGQDVKNHDVYDVTTKVRGKKGTKVELQIVRDGMDKPITILVERDEIPIETVYSKKINQEEKNIGYIEITSFARETAADFSEHLRKLEEKKMDALIIDVRGNPGGILQSVQEIAGELVTNTKPMFQVEQKNHGVEQYFSKLKKKKPYPIAVLTNKGSASASEILAGALKEVEGYPTIGETTFGKGTVQQQLELGDKSHIKLTMFKWLTPDGNWIHKKGIKPDIFVVQPELYNVHPLEINQPLSIDMNNEQIKNAQQILESLGFEPGRKDGYFNETTAAAVRTFQEESGLNVTGIIDEKTALALEKRVIEEKEKIKNDRQLQMAIKYFEYRW